MTGTVLQKLFTLEYSQDHLHISPGLWQVDYSQIPERLAGLKYLKIEQKCESGELLKKALQCHHVEELFIKEAWAGAATLHDDLELVGLVCHPVFRPLQYGSGSIYLLLQVMRD